ncbi:MAG: serine/threonine protein kinase [Armatimonadetes bacterium]|nr:serine/threonine protein kinase [Armatimonadota bacterium]MDE2207754.1 serine/threonine protein kinase [Armatimonadota bacterium]
MSNSLEAGVLLNGRYKILGVLGRGGMGTVYLAEHVRLGAQVAVKEVNIPDTPSLDLDDALAGCEQEARMLVRLQHPNLPGVSDAFAEGRRFYLVMERIVGATIETTMRSFAVGHFPVTAAVQCSVQLADVLGYLHAQVPPVIFRDLKPANVMLQADGTVRLIDFGIARQFQPGLRQDTSVLGSVGYSPPEQFGSRQTDVRSDIYSLGATLHNMLTGRDPSKEPFRFPAASDTNRAVPPELDAVVARCVQASPEARYQSAAEVSQALAYVMSILPPSSVSQQLTSLGVEAAELAPHAGPSARLQSPSGGSAPGSAGEANARTVLPSSAGTKTGARLPRSVQRSIAGVSIAVILGLGAFILRTTVDRKHPAPRAATGTATNQLPTPGATSPAPVARPQRTAAGAIIGQTAASSVEAVSFTGIGAGRDGGMRLRFGCAGTLVNLTGKQVRITLLFYTADGQPVPVPGAVGQPNQPTPQLCVFQTYTPQQDRESFDIPLDLPVTGLPEGVAGPVFVRGAIYKDGVRIAATDRLRMPVNYPASASGSTGSSAATPPAGAAPPSGNAPPDGSQAAPSSPGADVGSPAGGRNPSGGTAVQPPN